MKYLSVCAGIEAATVAWHHMGWTPAAFSEIEPFPSAVLAHHYPQTPNLGDMTRYKEWDIDSIDLLVGGTPCQSFSVAGLRKGLDDPRGNLMLTFGSIAQRYQPKWLVWENVPGVLSSNAGRDFGTFLGMLGELGYGFAYRVLDAQYFGVAQRRRRVFVVGCLGSWQRAAAVLFDSKSLSGNLAPSRKTRKDTSGSTGDGIARCLTAGEMKRQDWEICNLINHAPAMAYDILGVPATNGAKPTDVHTPLRARLPGQSEASTTTVVAQSVAIEYYSHDYCQDRVYSVNGISPALNCSQEHTIRTAMQVRRLTPVECERLQGFPDGYTAIAYRNKSASECPDGPRYKALGNSMAVPVMRWIGERIQKVAHEL